MKNKIKTIVSSKNFITLIISLLLMICSGSAQNVIIIVIDGARYSETFELQDIYIPYMWNEMKPYGTIYEKFYNQGMTSTNPGHASIATGTWQNIPNDGSDRPTMPTVFEYFRHQLSISQEKNYFIGGKSKLSVISYSKHSN